MHRVPSNWSWWIFETKNNGHCEAAHRRWFARSVCFTSEVIDECKTQANWPGLQRLWSVQARVREKLLKELLTDFWTLHKEQLPWPRNNALWTATTSRVVLCNEMLQNTRKSLLEDSWRPVRIRSQLPHQKLRGHDHPGGRWLHLLHLLDGKNLQCAFNGYLVRGDRSQSVGLSPNLVSWNYRFPTTGQCHRWSALSRRSILWFVITLRWGWWWAKVTGYVQDSTLVLSFGQVVYSQRGKGVNYAYADTKECYSQRRSVYRFVI